MTISTRYHKFVEYKSKKKVFLNNLLNNYLVSWFLDEKNDGKDPFISIKIFQYDESKMKEGKDRVVEHQQSKMSKLKVLKEVENSVTTKHMKKETAKHWVGDESNTKVVKSRKKRVKEKDSILISEKQSSEFIDYDPEVHCFIENYNEVPIDTRYVVACGKETIIEKNELFFDSVVPLSQDIIGKAVIRPGGEITLNRDYSPDYQKMNQLLLESVSVNCTFDEFSIITPIVVGQCSFKADEEKKQITAKNDNINELSSMASKFVFTDSITIDESIELLTSIDSLRLKASAHIEAKTILSEVIYRIENNDHQVSVDEEINHHDDYYEDESNFNDDDLFD
jgi:hypothetical protein